MDLNEQIKGLRDAAKRRKQALAMQQAGKTLKEIGEHFGVTRERARQLIAKAIKEMEELSQ